MALKMYGGMNGAVKVYASDWRLFIKQIKEIDPQQVKELQKRWKEISEPARDSVKAELKDNNGPMRGMRHGGRTGWGTNYGKVGSPVSGAKRKMQDNVSSSQLQKNKTKKGGTGIARLRVQSAGTVMADLAQKHGGRAYTRMYKIREFGGPEIMRSHEIRPMAVQEFLHNLGAVVKPSKRKKSRNVYPGFDKALPAVSAQAKKAIDETIRFIEKNIDRNNRP
jgi:hypothetical protein